MYQQAKRRSSSTLLDRSKALARKINGQVHSNRRKWIRKAVLNGGQRGLWKAYNRAEGKTQEAYHYEINYEDVTNTTLEDKATAIARYTKEKWK